MLDPLEPEELKRVRALIPKNIPEVQETFDHRGFRVQHWLLSHTTNKPIELSLKHEARLIALADHTVSELLEDLATCENSFLGKKMLANSFGALIVQRYDPPRGFQTTDHYYDVPSGLGSAGAIEQLFTIGERIKGNKFMTWRGALNLELPFVAVGPAGMTARLEFNWIDDVNQSLACARGENATPEEQCRNPFHLVTLATGLSLPALEPVIEHTTKRHKFELYNESEKQIFALNINFVRIRHLATMVEAAYIDIDISGVSPVDAAEFARVLAFASALSSRYRLAPNRQTKASRGLLALGRKQSGGLISPKEQREWLHSDFSS